MTVSVVVNGPPRAGKDTFVDMCMILLRDAGFTCSKHSSVDMVKKAAELLGWDGVKDERGRQFLSDIKDLSTVAYNGPFLYMLDVVATRQHDVMFFHIREPEEISEFVRYTNGVKVIVERPGCPTFSNHADKRVRLMTYDFDVYNDKDLNKLSARAAAFVKVLCVRQLREVIPQNE